MRHPLRARRASSDERGAQGVGAADSDAIATNGGRGRSRGAPVPSGSSSLRLVPAASAFAAFSSRIAFTLACACALRCRKVASRAACAARSDARYSAGEAPAIAAVFRSTTVWSVTRVNVAQ